MQWEQAEPHCTFYVATSCQDAEDPAQEEEFWRGRLSLRGSVPPTPPSVGQ